MTKIDIYKCDRCGAEIRKRTGEKPVKVQYFESPEETHSYDLCEDCNSSFWLFLKTYQKEVDALFSELCK